MGLPVVMDSVGDHYTDPARIQMIIWEGATNSADVCELVHPDTGERIWKGRTDATQTYLGAHFGTPGVPAPNGFRLALLGAGTVTIYLNEV